LFCLFFFIFFQFRFYAPKIIQELLNYELHPTQCSFSHSVELSWGSAFPWSIKQLPRTASVIQHEGAYYPSN